jgi:tetratricopeptide (TPR) repeat protein
LHARIRSFATETIGKPWRRIALHLSNPPLRDKRLLPAELRGDFAIRVHAFLDARKNVGSELIKMAISLALAQMPAKLEQAIGLQQGGRLAEAQTIYEEILKIQPRHFDALYLLGIIANQTNNFERAVELFGQAIDTDPNSAAAYSNRGVALKGLKQLEAALASCTRAIEIDAGYAEAYCNRGVILEGLTQWDAALTCYNQAIAIKADFVEAYYNRGNVLRDQQQWEAALASFNHAIEIKADFVEAHVNRGHVLRELKQWDAALADYNQAIAIKADSAEAYYNRGVVLYDLKQWDAALANYNQAIAIKPDYAAAHCNRGNVLRDLKQWKAALASYDQAIAIKVDFVEAYLNRGAVLIDLKELDAALASCTRAIEIDADYAEAHYNRGVALYELKQWDAALASFNQAIAIKAGFVDAYSNRGLVLRELKQWEAALASYDEAIAINPGYAEAYLNRGAVLIDLKRVDEALSHYNRAIQIRANYADAYYNKSIALLLAGDLENGWLAYEWRWKNKGGPVIKETRDFRQPLWLGQESIARETILLHSEQGLGDTLQLCRYVKLVADLGAKVILEVQTPLVSLLAELEGVSQLVARGGDLPDFGYQCPLLSLPLAFNTNLNTIPSSIKYLSADATKAAQWHAKLGENTKPRIGLVWCGSTLHTNDRNRSILLADLIQYLPAEFQYVSLQKDLREADQKALESNPHIVNFSDELNDFSDTAALCECLDLVISVDTSVAHLSGALGKRTWVVLPFSPDWRWLLDRDDSPWYASIKLYRQNSIGDWNGVFERVQADLIHAFK